MDADAVIAALGLQAHPEGGWYREIHRSATRIDTHGGARAAVTTIYYLLRDGERAHWHRVDADEIWHWHAGASLELRISADGITSTASTLGIALAAGARPQIVVPAKSWQSARSLGAFTLVGCTVAPGFEFSGFELAPPDWQPG